MTQVGYVSCGLARSGTVEYEKTPHRFEKYAGGCASAGADEGEFLDLACLLGWIVHDGIPSFRCAPQGYLKLSSKTARRKPPRVDEQQNEVSPGEGKNCCCTRTITGPANRAAHAVKRWSRLE
jgi:hypothetical protein